MAEDTIYEVGPVVDFPPGTHRVVMAGKRMIGVFNVGGSFYALPNLCPHQLGPLCRGVVSGTLAASEATHWKMEWVKDGEIITCPWHAMEYEIATGQCLAHPEIRLRHYDVWVEGEQVKLRL